MIKYLSKEDDFNNLINEGNYLVDFYADWCGPCKMLGPVLETINEVEIIKVNIDEFQDISNKYGVMSIPTIIYFEKGKEINKAVGFKNKEELLQLCNK